MRTFLKCLFAAGLVLGGVAAMLPAQAAQSTRTGQISVAQLVDLIERSAADADARNIAIAYLAGVGETAGILLAEGEKRQPGLIPCRDPLSMSHEAALLAVNKAAPDKGNWVETPATPILIADMLDRAGCR